MQYIKKIIFFLIIIPLIYICYIILFYKEYSSTYIYKLYYDKKINYAKQFKSPRIFVSGGSNVRFGIKTAYMQEELNIPSINMALAMGFEPDYLFHMLKKVIKKGDIVIIPMEYQNLLLEKYSDEARKNYILTYDIEYLFSLSLYDIFDTIFSVRIENILRSWKDTFFLNYKSYNEQLKMINANGDQIKNYGMKFKGKAKGYKLNNKPLKEYLGIKPIINFNKYCQKNGIEFYMTFPNIMYSEKLYQQKYLNFYEELILFYKNNNIKYIDYPTNTIFDKSLFYDSQYHLNQNGMDIRTKKLIDIIKKNILKI